MMARAARLLLLALLFAYVVTVVTGFRTTGQSNVPSGMRLLERTRSNDGEYLVVAQRHGSVHWPIFLTLLRRQREQGVDRGQMTSIAAVRWTFERIARTVYVDDNSDGEDQRTKWLAVPYDADPLSHFPEAKPFDDQDGCVLSSGEPAPICVGAVVAKSFVEAGWYRVRAEVTLVTNATAEAQAGMAYANSESPESRSQPAPATTTTTIDLHIRITTRQRSDFLPPVARREIRTLARDEWQRVVEGLHALKFVGVYDLLVAGRKCLFVAGALRLRNYPPAFSPSSPREGDGQGAGSFTARGEPLPRRTSIPSLVCAGDGVTRSR